MTTRKPALEQATPEVSAPQEERRQFAGLVVPFVAIAAGGPTRVFGPSAVLRDEELTYLGVGARCDQRWTPRLVARCALNHD